jgi:hypothetical protein
MISMALNICRTSGVHADRCERRCRCAYNRGGVPAAATGAVSQIVALADLEGSARLFAVTVTVCGLLMVAGAA